MNIVQYSGKLKWKIVYVLLVSYGYQKVRRSSNCCTGSNPSSSIRALNRLFVAKTLVATWWTILSWNHLKFKISQNVRETYYKIGCSPIHPYFLGDCPYPRRFCQVSVVPIPNGAAVGLANLRQGVASNTLFLGGSPDLRFARQDPIWHTHTKKKNRITFWSTNMAMENLLKV